MCTQSRNASLNAVAISPNLRSALAQQYAGSLKNMTLKEATVAAEFNTLERNILRAKGLSDEQLGRLSELGIVGRADFQTVGDLSTLLELMPDLDLAVAVRLLEWALPAAPMVPGGAVKDSADASQSHEGRLVIDSSDSVYCVHCQFKQPKDYTPGDLCPNCGLQAEPIETCYWCGSAGPGRFCRVSPPSCRWP